MDLQNILNIAKNINQINKNDYFVFLNTHGITPEKFVKSQKNFGLAVNYWSIILGKLFITLPSYKERKLLVKNLYDENGDISHVESFDNFMNVVSKHFKISSEHIKPDHENCFHISHFTNFLEGMVETQTYQHCALVLGMIEYVYMTVSNIIHNYVAYYMKTNDIPHYSLHEILDMSHATDLFNIALSYKNLTVEDVNKGLEIGYTLMSELYSGLLNYGLEK
jgi:hypothetical protein